MIDWTSFTPWSALAGGLLIGVAAAMFVLFNGRVAGISGILGGLLRPAAGDVGWRAAFVAGLVFAPLAYVLVAPLPVVTSVILRPAPLNVNVPRAASTGLLPVKAPMFFFSAAVRSVDFLPETFSSNTTRTSRIASALSFTTAPFTAGSPKT